jgi:methanethiol S-methyltransferase
MMSKPIYLLLSVIIYAIFFATFLYLIAFVGAFPIVPHTVDHGPFARPLGAAIIDVALIAIFGLQHSVMARQGFKRAWTRVVPVAIERSAYVLFASLALMLLFACWHPIAGALWVIGNPIGRDLMYAIFAAGWLIVLLSTFLLNHFELFGLSQTFLHLRGREPAAPKLREPLFYRLVRHPLYSGFFLAFWATPVMSYGHLLLAVGMSVYMLIAIPHEERDMIELFGDQYEDYRGRVGKLTPRLRRAAK